MLADWAETEDSCRGELSALADDLSGQLNRQSTVNTGASDKFHIPFPMNYEFYGREEELERLHEALQSANGHIVGIRPIAGLTGMGGIGKTQLAVVLRPGLAQSAQDKQIMTVAEYVAQNPNTLLVLDNLPLNPKGNLLGLRDLAGFF